MSDSGPTDLHGRTAFRFKNNRFPYIYLDYIQIGDRFSSMRDVVSTQLLDKQHGYDEPLFPQQTVVQYNSTFLETTDRNELRRGEVTYFGLLFLCAFLYAIGFGSYATIDLIVKQNYVEAFWFGCISFMVVCALPLLFVMISTELFTYRHFPVRFNRKNGKVYVRKYNRKVVSYDWDTLDFYIVKLKNTQDIRAIILEKDKQTVKDVFALGFKSRGDFVLHSYFEFIRRYMTCKDSELGEVTQSVRYIYPIHAEPESRLTTARRIALKETYNHGLNLEYPEEAYYFDWLNIINLPFIWAHYIGRRISMLTSKAHRFPDEIEQACPIAADDPYDLNKNLPEGNLTQRPPKGWQVTGFVLVSVMFSTLMLLVFAVMLDFVSFLRPHDEVNYFESVWDFVTLSWL